MCEYGELNFKTSSGVQEQFQVSNADSALEFASRLKAYQKVLAASESANHAEKTHAAFITDSVKHEVQTHEDRHTLPTMGDSPGEKKADEFGSKKKFYAMLDGDVKGLFDTDELAALRKAAVMDDSSLLCVEGKEDWHRFDHFFRT